MNSDLRDTILDAALKHAGFDGWNQRTLERAAQEAGLSAFDVTRSFPGGVAEVLAYFSARADAELEATLSNQYDLPNMKVRERIATAVMVRLRANAKHREAIRRAVSFYNMPWNTPHALKALWATMDVIWRAAGDTATDWNHYSKRAILSKVYSATLYVWLNDDSDDFANTEAFLRRRIDNVMQFEKFKAKAKQSCDGMASWMPNFVKR
jgi:ubiquinone biosynthesis protein COQ9